MKLSTRVFAILLCIVAFSCSEKSNSDGDVYFNNGDFEQAIAAYTESLEFKPNDVKILYNRGRAHEEQGNFEEAKDDFEKALSFDANNFQVLLSLANLHHKEKNYTNALLFSNRAAEIPGAPAMASFMKGRALHQLGKRKEALDAYRTAISLDKDFGQAYYNRGLLKVAMKNVGGSCEDFQLARALEYPGASDAYNKYCQ